jgi:hypothetical protein
MLGVQLYQIVYGSYARRAFTRPELASLLNAARTRNRMTGITGLLLYHDENFLQVLEGEEVAVESAYERIRRDPRHAGVMVLHRGPVEARQFQDWTMAYLAPTAEELRSAGVMDLRASELRRLGGPQVQAFIKAFERMCNLAPA